MPSLTRRRALHGVVALLAGVAGCAGEQSAGSSYPPESIENVDLDPDSYSLRHAERTPVVWSGEQPTPVTETEAETRWHLRHHLLVADASDAADISFADIERAGDARAFLDATDYDAATVYVEQTPVEECFENELCHVRWSETEVTTSYARRYRDADVACETGAEDVVATLIRIPATLDPSEVSGYGSSRGSASCARRNERIRRQRQARNGSDRR
ncbi:hypothetical protein [Haloplanus halobius]|uniref:hypothetical protein n=1 Tax=Haloplanus halobius TaxID=2934938 RepID=UPI00200C17DA|nr:hypothetical protein [Haloplanus sp. XH21]